MICRTLADVIAAADADSKQDPPLTQEQADYMAAVLASCRHNPDGSWQVPSTPAARSRES